MRLLTCNASTKMMPAGRLMRMLVAFLFVVPALLGPTAVTAFADNGATGITIVTQDGSSHKYAAHRLLAGTAANGNIANPSLDACIPVEAYSEAGATTSDIASAQTVAKWLGTNAANDASGVFTATLANAVLATEAKFDLKPAFTFATIDVVTMEQGYWLITSDDAQPMLVLIEGGKILEVTEKSTVPMPSKWVKRDDSDDDWAESVSAGEGDVLNYRVEVTMPSNLKAFTSYTLWISDSLSQGLEYVQESAMTYVRHSGAESLSGSAAALTAQSDGELEKVDLEARISDDGRTLTAGSDNILKVIPNLEPTDILVVEYKGVVNEYASNGFDASNIGTLTLEYSRSPTTTATNTTAVSSVVRVYCFQIDIHKTRGQ